MQSICPYKSPQAWIVFNGFRAISRAKGIALLLHFFRGGESIGWQRYASAFNGIMKTLSSWSDADLEVIRRSEAVETAPPFYALKAFRWLVAEIGDDKTMRQHLQTILMQNPLHLVMPAVFDQWFVHPDGAWTEKHVRDALNSTPTEPNPLLNPVRETELFRRLMYWINISSIEGGNEELVKLLRDLWTRLLRDGSSGDSDQSLFSSIDSILENETTSGIDAELWSLFIEIGQIATTSNDYWRRLTIHLSRFITSSSADYALHKPTATSSSLFVRSRPGLIREVNDIVIDREIFVVSSEEQKTAWIEAMDIVRRVQAAEEPQRSRWSRWSRRLLPWLGWKSEWVPKVQFRPIPGFFSLPLSKLEEDLNLLSGLVDLEADSSYLNSFKEQWNTARWPQRGRLIEILSKHINDYQPRPVNASPSDLERTFPFVMSSAGLDLINFVHARLVRLVRKEDRQMVRRLPAGIEDRWSEAVARVVEIRQLPDDHFPPLGGSDVVSGMVALWDQGLDPTYVYAPRVVEPNVSSVPD
ncbi:hypothetical protein AAF712_016162 [Marasmius tenuissimus]|uniref:Uncharacterized protein n=1 Tax=Marasmius tenuissimus TaxID=585030 RepID=A0ABR2Z7G4_9AGAR